MKSTSTKYLSLLAAALICLAPGAVMAKTYVVQAVVRSFSPQILHIKPGDTVQWENMASHDTVAYPQLVPKGAKPWAGQIGQNFSVTLTKEGVYAYYCQPHIGFGMVGAIVVGKPVNIDEELAYARKNLKGPFRRLIGVLFHVKKQAESK
jgi:pseudoazurin